MEEKQGMNAPETGQQPRVENQGTHLEREDERFTQRGRLGDWLTLLIMIAAYLAWTGVVYFFEPGIR